MSAMPITTGASRSSTYAAIVEAAAQLLRTGGAAAVTTRAVATEAGVQAPTIYRLFGDKDGLLDAVAEHVFATYVSQKSAAESDTDPVADLRAGWDAHIAFGLANPSLITLLIDPARGDSPAAAAGMETLLRRIHRIAVAGRLAVSERRALELVHAAGTGVVLTLLAQPAPDRDPGLAAAAYAAVLRAIVTDAPAAPARDLTAAAVTLRAGLGPAGLPGHPALSNAERTLLAEWLDRIIEPVGTASD